MKKMLVVISLLLFVQYSYSQDKIVSMGQLTLKGKIYYFDDKPFTGKCYDKRENGKIGLKGQFVDGMKDGLWTWWYSTGQVKRESTFIRNKKEGMTTYWHLNGVKSKEIMYRNDKNIDQKLWDENGNRLPNPSFTEYK